MVDNQLLEYYERVVKECLTECDGVCNLYNGNECQCVDANVLGHLKELKEYKNAEEQGLLLRLPYPLETRYVYAIDDDDVIRLNAMDLSIGKDGRTGKTIYTVDSMDYYFEEFGEIVFLTQAEAEAALEKMKGEEHE